MENKEEVTMALQTLVKKIKDIINDGITKGTLTQCEEAFVRWKIHKFEYTEIGLRLVSAYKEGFTEPTWWRASLKVLETIKQTEEYHLASEILSKHYKQKERFIENFSQKVIFETFEMRIETSANSLIERFLKDLEEEPAKMWALVELDGIIILPDKEITLLDGNTIRRPKPEDLETRIPSSYLEFSDIFEGSFPDIFKRPHPSAILRIEISAKEIAELEEQVEKAIAILRLFRVGGVRRLSYNRMGTESLTKSVRPSVISGRLATPFDYYAIRTFDSYAIRKEDINKLQDFWRLMYQRVPRSFYSFEKEKTDYLYVAFSRYNDAMFHSFEIERRIMDAIMGLEALYLGEEERQELVYRIKTRIAKIFSILGEDSIKIKEELKRSYKIRNTYAHGGVLDYNQKKKLKSKYGDIKNLLFNVLNYLRISILLMLLCGREKKELLRLIDDSLINPKKECELSSLLSKWREVVF